jgi:(2Fe-2S) ferredoxin
VNQRKARQATVQAVAKAVSRGISVDGTGGYTRHVLLCVGKSCCDGEDYKETWKRLNKRLKRLEKEGKFIYRTRVACLDICRSGPLLVIYPDGTWYHSVTLKLLDRIIDEHLLEGRVVRDYAFAFNPLQSSPGCRTDDEPFERRTS